LGHKPECDAGVALTACQLPSQSLCEWNKEVWFAHLLSSGLLGAGGGLSGHSVITVHFFFSSVCVPSAFLYLNF
jgi:hypothetical protein